CADSGTSGTSCTPTLGGPVAPCAGRDLSVEDRAPGRSGGPEARQFLRARERARMLCAAVFPIWNIAAQNLRVTSQGSGEGLGAPSALADRPQARSASASKRSRRSRE